MRTIGCCVVLMLWGGVAFAQRSVVLDELTSTEVRAAIAGGKTTLLVYTGGTHQNEYSGTGDEFRGPGKDAVVIGKHTMVANYITRRVAEVLGDALTYNAFPHAPNTADIIGGTVALRDETFAAVLRDIVTSAAKSGFKLVVLLNDHGAASAISKKLADELTRELSSKGTRVIFSPVYDEARIESAQYISKLPGVPPLCKKANEYNACQVAIIDAAEVAAIEKGKWVRRDSVPPAVAKFVTPEVGKILLEQKVTLAVGHIRQAMAKSQPPSR